MSKHKSKHKPKAISLMINSNLIDKKCILYFFQGNLNNLKAKQVNIKKNKYHTININDLDPFLLDIKKKSSKDIDIYYINYIQENLNSSNPLRIKIDSATGYFKEKK